MALDLTGAVLLPIDLQQGFENAAWPARWNSDMDRNAQALLAAWRAAGRAVVHIRHDSIEAQSTLRPGQPGNAFRSGLEPGPGEAVVSKSVNSAFIGTDLDRRLRQLGAASIVTFGLSTDMCVSTTVRTGANMGWPMILVHDACDCFDLRGLSGATIPARAVHEAHVATLAFEFCSVVTTADVLAALAI